MRKNPIQIDPVGNPSVVGFLPDPQGAAEGKSPFVDLIGICVSIGCAIHCAAMPFVIAYLPILGVSFLADPAFHKVMVGVCALLALAAFMPGWRRHRRFLPTTIAIIGIGFISASAFCFEDSCCASCASSLETASEVEAQAKGARLGGEAIGNDCCSLTEEAGCSECCSNESKMEEHEAGGSTQLVAALSQLAPWFTPFGGFLLIGAHLTNRRLVCLCGCCSTQGT